MKKFVLATATIALLTVSSFAASKGDEDASKLRVEYYKMQIQMNDHEMEMLRKRMDMLSAYQRLLKNMMANELASH